MDGKEVKRVGEKEILWGFGRGKTKEREEIERKREWEGGAEERKMWMAWRGWGYFAFLVFSDAQKNIKTTWEPSSTYIHSSKLVDNVLYCNLKVHKVL